VTKETAKEDLPEPGVTKETAKEDYEEDEKYLLALLHTLVKILYVKGCLRIVSYLTNVLGKVKQI
jgi:hypothetical protein